MAFRIKASHLIAAAITVAIVGWMATGTVQIGGRRDNSAGAAPIAQREADRSAKLFTVSTAPILPQTREETLLVRGRTQADAIIPIRVEAGGILNKRYFDKGDKVKSGDVACEIDPAWRESKVAQAEAGLARASSDFESATQLSEKGFSSEANVRQQKAALEAARAVLAEATIELERTRVHANAEGTVQDPIAEMGDMLKAGDVCVTLIDRDPMLFIGQVSERQIRDIKTGMAAEIELVTGQKLSGRVNYISPSADPQTRTFRTEIEINNTDGEIRDGLTATAHISLQPTTAFQVSPAWISLSDKGEIGVKTVDENGIVAFVPAKIVAQSSSGFWITGPEPGAMVITRGHEYVLPGEKVDTMRDPLVGARVEDSVNPGSGERTE
jgi:membrane fusion protein, multidrug efflux system